MLWDNESNKSMSSVSAKNLQHLKSKVWQNDSFFCCFFDGEFKNLERETGSETWVLPSTTRSRHGAGNGIQTRDLRLGKATLYQLSYSRERASWLSIWAIQIARPQNAKSRIQKRIFEIAPKAKSHWLSLKGPLDSNGIGKSGNQIRGRCLNNREARYLSTKYPE